MNDKTFLYWFREQSSDDLLDNEILFFVSPLSDRILFAIPEYTHSEDGLLLNNFESFQNVSSDWLTLIEIDE